MDVGTVPGTVDDLPGRAAAPTALLVVEVDGRRCGFSVEAVVELLRMVASTSLPKAPAHVDGVIDVHGTVVAVLDLRARLGLSRRPARPSDHLVLARLQDRTVALRVDRILDLATVVPTTLEDALGLPPQPHLRGVARLDDGLLLIHDIGAFLSADEAAVLDDALAELTTPEEGEA